MSIAADKLHLLDFSDVTVRGRRLRTRHPGLLLAELLDELAISQAELARSIGDAVHRAYKGELCYQYTDEANILRVVWER